MKLYQQLSNTVPCSWSLTCFCVSTREQKFLALLAPPPPPGKRWALPSSLSPHTSLSLSPHGGTSSSSRQSWQEVVEPSNRHVELQAGVDPPCQPSSLYRPPLPQNPPTQHTIIFPIRGELWCSLKEPRCR
jgi:hypothetical protein